MSYKFGQLLNTYDLPYKNGQDFMDIQWLIRIRYFQLLGPGSVEKSTGSEPSEKPDTDPVNIPGSRNHPLWLLAGAIITFSVNLLAERFYLEN